MAAIVFALLWPTLYTFVYFLGVKDAPPLVGQAVYAVGKVLQFGFPLAWMLFYERPRLRGDIPKLAPRRRAASAALGLAFGAAVAGAMLAGYHWWLKPAGLFAAPAVLVQAKLADFQLAAPLRYLALAVFYSLLHSAMEEYYWRWFVFRRLSWLAPLSFAIGLSSVGFMAHHAIVLFHYFGDEKWLAALFTAAIAIGGAVWAWLYHHYRSLLGPWLSHLLIDAAIFAIGYDLIAAS